MLIKFNNEEKVLELLFKYPTVGFTFREMSRKIRISTPTISKIVNELKRKGLVKIKEEGNLFIVRGNIESERFRELKRVYNIFSLIELRKFLIHKFNPSLICVYGSYAFGEDLENSDVDIFIESEKNYHVNLSKFEKKLNRKVHLITGNLSIMPKELEENILTGVVLYGSVQL